MKPIAATHVTKSFDAAVMGGGIIGVAIAGSLLEMGLSVVLIERGSVGAQGASRYSGGIVRLYDPDEAICGLAAYSLARMSDTVVGRACAACINRTGVYYAPATMPSVEAIKSFRGDLEDYPVEIVARACLGDGIGIGPDGVRGPGLWEAAGGYADVRASARMIAKNIYREGLILENARVEAVERTRNSVAIRLEAAAIRAQCIVLALGAWTAPLLPQLRLFARSVPMVRFRACVGLAAPIIDEAVESYMLPLGHEALQVGSRKRKSAKDPDKLEFENAAIVTDACRRLQRMIGAPAGARPIDVVPGFDSYSEDGRPAIGWLDETNVFVAAGFCGIGYKLAVGVGRLVALRVVDFLGKRKLGEHEAALLEPFRPSRFEPLGCPVPETW